MAKSVDNLVPEQLRLIRAGIAGMHAGGIDLCVEHPDQRIGGA